MSLTKLLDNLITINFNFSDNRKIEITAGEENRGNFFLSSPWKQKEKALVDKEETSKRFTRGQ